MPRELNPRQARFVDEYPIDLNGRRAAIRAGYSENGADVQAVRLLKDPRIAAAIAAKRAKISEKAEVTQEYVLARLTENVERAMQVEPVRDREGNETGEYTYQGAVANRALELLGKHLGMFSENVNLRTPDGPLAVTVTRRVVQSDASGQP